MTAREALWHEMSLPLYRWSVWARKLGWARIRRTAMVSTMRAAGIMLMPPPDAWYCATLDVRAGGAIVSIYAPIYPVMELPGPTPGQLLTVRCGGGDPIVWGAAPVWNDGRRRPVVFFGGS